MLVRLEAAASWQYLYGKDKAKNGVNNDYGVCD